MEATDCSAKDYVTDDPPRVARLLAKPAHTDEERLTAPRLIGTYGYNGDSTSTVQMLRDMQTAWRALGASAEFLFKPRHREYGDCMPDCVEIWVR